MKNILSIVLLFIMTNLLAQKMDDKPNGEVSIFNDNVTVSEKSALSAPLKNSIAINALSLFRGYTTINFGRLVGKKTILAIALGPSFINYLEKGIAEEFGPKKKYEHFLSLEAERPGIAGQVLLKIYPKGEIYDGPFVAFDFLSYTNIMVGATNRITSVSGSYTYDNIKWRTSELRAFYGGSIPVSKSNFVFDYYIYGGLKISSFPILETVKTPSESYYQLSSSNTVNYGFDIGVGFTFGYCF